jgi:hypothetical protein
MAHFNISIIFCFMFLLFFELPLLAQTRLSVDLNEPIYTFIEMAEVKGILTKVSQVKPYTNQDIVRMLARIKAREFMLTERERKILDSFILQYQSSFQSEDSIGKQLLRTGSIDIGDADNNMRLGLKVDFLMGMSAENPINYMGSVPLQLYLKGDLINSLFSYNVNIGLTFAKMHHDPFVHWGQVPVMGMGFWQRSWGDKSSEIWDRDEMDAWAMAFEMNPEVAAQFWDDRILVRWGRLNNREVGSGLAISQDAAPFSAFELGVRPVDWFNFYFMVGSLSGGPNTLGSYQGADTEFHNDRLVQNSKMISYHIGEFFLTDYFYFNVWESMVWGKRFEAAYLMPVNIFLFSQNMVGDLDNYAFGLGGATIIPGVMKLSADIFLDEFQVTGLLSNPRNMFGLNTQARFNIPKVPFTQLTFGYTHISPYVYTHYPQSYATNGLNTDGHQVLTDTGYNNRGKSIGSMLKPNSDQFKLGLDSLPMPGLSLSFGYSLVRHGGSVPKQYYLGSDGRYYDNPSAMQGNVTQVGNDPVWAWDRDGITGELNGYLDYNAFDKNPWKRKFLKDAIYDWTNSFSLEAGYDLRHLKGREGKLPVVVNVGYTFAYTFYRYNGFETELRDTLADGLEWSRRWFGNTYENHFKNIFTLSISIFPG